MSVKFPAYMDKLSPEARAQARVRFLLKLAALYACPDGSLTSLSTLCGYHPGTMAVRASSHDKINPAMAVRIEESTHSEVVTREILCPELFERA